jgi:hypothetical protein
MQEDRIMQAIEGCHFDFQSWQCADISSDELIFEETPSLEPPPHLPLRVDVLSNVGFIEYEETMFNLLDRIEKIKTGDYQQCDIAKRNIFSSVEDELHRLSRTCSFIRFSELESLSLDMIRWLVT